MRFTHIDINFDVRYEGHQNCPKILSMNILRVFSDHHLWCQNWRQYLWTSLCQFIFFVNLLHSLGVWFFDIWHSFWQLDIFLTTWHLFDNLTSFWYFGSKSPMGPIAHVAHTPVPHYPCIPLPTWPIPLVPHTPCAPYCPCAPYPQWASLSISRIPLYPLPMWPIAHVAHTPCTPYPVCPYCPCAPYILCPHCP